MYTLLLVIFAGCSVWTYGQTAKLPRLEKAPCAVAVPETEKRADCAYLVVKENRTTKSSRTIRLPIAILKSEAANPKPDPVLKTLGGPGASSLRMVRGRRSFPWLKDRDFIIFEQRGTRYAQPSLECDEVDNARADSARKRLDQQRSKAAEIAAAAACFERLKGSGVDLNAYNTRESAADIEDLRRVLGLDKINLYGVSYSARLMLEVMRIFPLGIRSVVLESTLPPEVNYDEVGVDGLVRALDELFTSCRTDAACTRAYPQLETEFYSVVSRLNRQPLIVSTPDPKTRGSVDLSLSGDDFATWIIDYLFSNEPAATADAPMVIHKAFTGNYVDQFKAYAGDKLGSGPHSWGMRYSVWCGEERPFESREKIAAQSSRYPGLRGYEVMALPDICRVWPVRRAEPIENRSVRSSIPTLVLAAQYDAYTDPAWGRAVSGRLINSFFFEIPWAGHGPAFSVPCVNAMIGEFIAAPGSPPPSSCIEDTRKKFKFTIGQ